MLKKIDGRIEIVALFIVKRLYVRCLPEGIKELGTMPSMDFKQLNGSDLIPFNDQEVKNTIQELG